MSGNLARRRQTKFMPADFKLIEARQPPLKDQYDEWLEGARRAAGRQARRYAPAIGEANPHHDERGQFATADGAVATVGSPARKPRPTGVQVASNDAVMSDATVDGGTAEEAAVGQIKPGAGPDGTPTPNDPTTRNENGGDPGSGKPTPEQDLRHVHDVPDDAVSYTTSDGTDFYTQPYANFQKVYAAGQANWQNPIAAFSAI